MMSQPSHITFRRHTFLSSLAMGLCSIVITLVISGTVMVLYVAHLAGEKSDRILALAQGVIHGLPAFAQSLPPALSDMLNDRRDPRYLQELSVSAQVVSAPDEHGRIRTEIEVVNQGNAVVSLLSLRIILLDEKQRLLCESQEWAATPVTTDGGWRGPILPGAKRRFVSYAGCPWAALHAETLDARVEVTELRIWNETNIQNMQAKTEITYKPADSDKNG